MILISCDPGVAKDSAFAVFQSNTLVEVFKTNNLKQIKDYLDSHGVTKLIAEDQYFGVNIKTLMDLTRQTGKIIEEEPAEAAKKMVEFLHKEAKVI